MSIPIRLGRLATLQQPPRQATRHGDQRDTKNTRDTKPLRRTYSNNSVSSAVSSVKSEVDDQFPFSPHLTPSHERASFFPPTHSRGPSSHTASAVGSAQQSLGKRNKQSFFFPSICLRKCLGSLCTTVPFPKPLAPERRRPSRWPLPFAA